MSPQSAHTPLEFNERRGYVSPPTHSSPEVSVCVSEERKSVVMVESKSNTCRPPVYVVKHTGNAHQLSTCTGHTTDRRLILLTVQVMLTFSITTLAIYEIVSSESCTCDTEVWITMLTGIYSGLVGYSIHHQQSSSSSASSTPVPGPASPEVVQSNEPSPFTR